MLYNPIYFGKSKIQLFSFIESMIQFPLFDINIIIDILCIYIVLVHYCGKVY